MGKVGLVGIEDTVKTIKYKLGWYRVNRSKYRRIYAAFYFL